MYETFFHLTSRPFTAAPLVDNYIPNQYAEQALHTLSRSIERGEGPGMIIGATGTGKSFVLQLLAACYGEKFQIAYLASARFSTPRALLQNVLYELNRPYKRMDEEELRLALNEHLTGDDADERPLLLLVDEAHALSLRLLEEIRMITNLTRKGEPLVRLVLAGNARLEERFTNPKLDSFNQRIAARCYLESLNREESTNYVCQQLKRAGGDPQQLVADDAFHAIYTASDGVPRLLNQVCDQALILAAVAGNSQIDAACVEEAWADLQQLPTPWNRDRAPASKPAASAGSVVEFGTLGEAAEPKAAPEPKASSDDALLATEQKAAPAAENSSSFSYDTGVAADHTMELESLRHSVESLATDAKNATGEQPLEIDSPRHSIDDEVEFQPAGFVGPEVELIFHGAHHPFGETFAEEEVVIDHYASLEKTIDKPSVHDHSGVSAEIATVLEEAEEPRESISLSVVADDDDIAVADKAPADDLLKEQDSKADLATITNDWEAAADEPLLPDYADEAELIASVDRAIPEPVAAAASRPNEESFDAEADDRDIIIIEDQRREATAVATKSRNKARRQEYRQLFARLRKGG